MLGVDFVLTGQFRLEPILASLPVGFLVTLVAYLKGAHYRFREDSDNTIILNLKPATAAWLMALAYLTLAAGVLGGILETPVLLGLLTMPFAFPLVQKLKTYKTIPDYLWATVYSLVIFISTGILMSIGLLISQ
jgi:1,4-dihydroxy-2-naphthoate octaprenyltransferase